MDTEVSNLMAAHEYVDLDRKTQSIAFFYSVLSFQQPFVQPT